MGITMATAHDYERQEWVHGIDGDRIALKHAHEDLALFSGPDADAFAAFLGIPAWDRERYIASMVALLSTEAE